MARLIFRVDLGRAIPVQPFVNVLGALLCSAAAFSAALWLAEGGLKQWIVAGILASIPFLMVLYPHPKHFLLAGWIFTLTYNRQYFSFEALFGRHGSQGPYWIVSDVFLLGLLLHAVYMRVVNRVRPEPKGPPFWPWYLPLVLAWVISLAGAERPEWGVFELWRSVKFGFILWYTSRYLNRREWWICVAALGLAMVFQSSVGLKEIVTGRSGVIGMEQQPSGPGGFGKVFSQESFYGSVRATGTMNHPPNLACYLLQVLPVALALLLGTRWPRVRWIAGLVAAAGAVGLACTLSRWPWALAAGQALLVALAMVATCRLTAQRLVGMLALTAVLAGIGLYPLREKIYKRFTGDFSASVDQRVESTRVAMRMIEDSPVTGVGLNNSAYHLVKYFPSLRWAIDNDEFLVTKVKSRALAVVGNGFLYVPVEAGALGALGFLVYLMGVAIVAGRALRSVWGDVQLACIGMAAGMLGVILQQVIDFSYWVDPLLFTFALVVGLLNTAPGLFPDQKSAELEWLHEDS